MLMVAEVNGPGGNVVTALNSAAVKAEAPVSSLVKPGSTGLEDVVQLTDLGTRLQELSKAIEDVPEVDRVRVEQLRQALADGSYQVEPDAIADKLIALENLLGTGKRS